MGLINLIGKTVGTVLLGSAGIASTLLRECACAAGKDELADAIGNIQDKSFETIRDMWTSEENKTESYYIEQTELSADRAKSAARAGEAKRREYERLKSKAGEKNQNK